MPPPPATNRALVIVTIVLLVGGAYVIDRVVSGAREATSTGRIAREAEAVVVPDRLQFVEGPQLEPRPDGAWRISWRTNKPTDTYVAFGRDNPDEFIIAKAPALSAEHRYDIPPQDFIPYLRYKVVAVTKDDEEVSAEIGPGGNGRWAALQDAVHAGADSPAVRPVRAVAWRRGASTPAVLHGSDVGAARMLLAPPDQPAVHIAEFAAEPGMRRLHWCDFNGDGRMELLGIGPSLAVIALPTSSVAAGQVLRTFDHTAPKDHAAAAVAFVDDDALPDIVGVTQTGAIVLHRSLGGRDIQFQTALIGTLPPTPEPPGEPTLMVADFTGDGRTDICVLRGALTLMPGPLTPDAQTRQAQPASDALTWAAPADWDGDGDLDIYVGGVGAGRLLRNDGRGRFEDAVGDSVELAALQGETLGGAWIDLDGNGLPDLLLCMVGAGVKVFLNTGRGRFMDATGLCDLLLPRDATPVAVSACDIDGDAAPDLCILLADGRFRLLENRWHEYPAQAWLRVQPTAPARRIVLLDPTSRHVVASVQTQGLDGAGVTLSPLGATFGVRERDSAIVRIQFADGSERSVDWQKGTPADGILKISPQATQRGRNAQP
jgi:FG-GAP-like repeat